MFASLKRLKSLFSEINRSDQLDSLDVRRQVRRGLESECESQPKLRTTGQRIDVFRYWL